MKYKITVVLECGEAPVDKNRDHSDTCCHIAATARDGALRALDGARNAKAITACVEYQVKVDVKD